MNILPRAVVDEIFNLEFRVSEQALEYVEGEFSRFGCVVSNHCDYDVAVMVYFNRPADAAHPRLEGELRIDRIERRFEIGVKYGDELIFPAYGDWNLVTKYLTKVLEVA
jgi:hypothetical protein